MEEEYTHHTLSVRKPRADWDVFVNMCIMADHFLQQYPEVLNDILSELDHVLHHLTWHKGLNTARWVLENKELVIRYAKYKQLSEGERELLKFEFKESIEKLMRH